MLKVCAVRSVHRASARAARPGSSGSFATMLVLGAAALGAYTYLAFPAILRRAAARLPAGVELQMLPLDAAAAARLVAAYGDGSSSL